MLATTKEHASEEELQARRVGEAVRVQRLVLQPELIAGGRPVDRIADDRVPDRREVHADLVRAPRLEAHGLQRVLRKRLDEPEVRDRRTRADAVDGPARAVLRIAADRRLDPPGQARGAAVHEREVLALDLATAQHPLQRLQRLAVARHDEQARRLAVEAVHPARAVRLAPEIGRAHV